jgi:hypothetical protein
VHRQLKLGRIALPGDETPPTCDDTSNYASPRNPPPIPFQPTASSLRQQPQRRWSAPISPYRPAVSLATQDRTKHNVHFAPSDISPSGSHLKIDLPPPFADSMEPSATPSQQRTLTLIGLAFAAASGVLSGMSLVLAKAAVELLAITIDHLRTGRGANQFDRVQSWLLVAGLGVGAILQLVYLNYSLTFASPALICPLAFCFYNLSSIFGESTHSANATMLTLSRWLGILRPIWPTSLLADCLSLCRSRCPLTWGSSRLRRPTRRFWRCRSRDLARRRFASR